MLLLSVSPIMEFMQDARHLQAKSDIFIQMLISPGYCVCVYTSNWTINHMKTLIKLDIAVFVPSLILLFFEVKSAMTMLSNHPIKCICFICFVVYFNLLPRLYYNKYTRHSFRSKLVLQRKKCKRVKHEQ